MPLPEQSTETPSKYNQSSFIGGMNLLGDDSRLQPNQYRIAFNITNRFDQLDLIKQSVEDTAIPPGLKQEIVTFGDYIIVFIAGFAWYRYYTDTAWKQIKGFQMSPTAPRYWTCAIPVATTNYLRLASTATISAQTFSNSSGLVNAVNIAGAAAGNLPGLLVQDNINQPVFIFLDVNGLPICRTTQKYTEWRISFTDATNTVVKVDNNGITQDFREYVPVGNVMAYSNGILYIASRDGSYIYRSVSGRPLDFVVNVTNTLATNAGNVQVNYTDPITGVKTAVVYPPFTQAPGGDATTTSYSVGVGGITCLRPISSGGIFVSAGNANFSVTLNQTPNAPTLFGEYTFIRTFLFNATCLSDRCIFDTLGDTRFVDLTGVRSFNAIEQEENEGRNSVFTSTIQGAFNSIIQDPSYSAAILYDNYELYAMETIFGPAIAKYDTINQVWVSFDINQTAGKRIKILSKIELDVQRLFAITEDDRLFTLYLGPVLATGMVRTVGVCANMLYANFNIKMNNPDSEIVPKNFRCIINNIKDSGELTFTPFVNNRITGLGTITKPIKYSDPVNVYTDPTNLPDVNTQLSNVLVNLSSCSQGWKVFGILSWNTGSITQYSMELNNLSPQNPLLSQGTFK